MGGCEASGGAKYAGQRVGGVVFYLGAGGRAAGFEWVVHSVDAFGGQLGRAFGQDNMVPASGLLLNAGFVVLAGRAAQQGRKMCHAWR